MMAGPATIKKTQGRINRIIGIVIRVGNLPTFLEFD